MKSWVRQFVKYTSSMCMGILCWSSPRDTRLYFQWDADNFKMTVTNPSGYMAMPQIQGPLNGFAVKQAMQQVDDLMFIQDQITFQWPRKNCDVRPTEKIFDCRPNADRAVRSDQINLSLLTTSVNEKNKIESVDKLRYKVTLLKDGSYYNLSFDFLNQRCFSDDSIVVGKSAVTFPIIQSAAPIIKK